ncbi:Snf7 [Corchorus olitorius]|uniref:Snf7 n=1 Tax=Corchorus olitorius TaxID=93759 RepID=A0A1R3G844_9ROSI|nr:Snf7 [Corchorus olitorius]
MDKFKNMLKPKPNPQQLLRDWQRKLRQECRNIERQIRGKFYSFPLKFSFEDVKFSSQWAVEVLDVQREEKSVQKAIREAAKRNDMGSAKALAKEIVMSRKAVNRLYENKAQLNSISMHLGESVGMTTYASDLVMLWLTCPGKALVNIRAIARTVGHLSKSAEVMKLVNNLMKAPQMAATMQEFSKEMTKAGVIEEIVNDTLDTALDSEDIEEETEEEVDKVLAEIAGETAAQLPEAVRKEKVRMPAQRESTSHEEEAIAEGADDEEELEAIRARLARVRS